MKNYFYTLYLNTEYDDNVLDEIVEFSHLNDDIINDENVAYYENELFDMESELICGNTEFPTKDRTTRAENRKLRRRRIRSRKGKYASVMGTDCPKAGKLAKGKEIEHRSRAYKWLRDGESLNQHKTKTTAREAMKDYETHGDYNDEEYDLDNGYVDEYEYLLEMEREDVLAKIRNVRTIAEAIWLASDFGQEIAYNIEYGEFPTQIYTDGLNMLIEETEIISGRQPLEW